MKASTKTLVVCVAAALAAPGANAFCLPQQKSVDKNTRLNALWKNWIPDNNVGMDMLVGKAPTSNGNEDEVSLISSPPASTNEDAAAFKTGGNTWTSFAAAAAILIAMPFAANAVSGGGLDYAGLDISNQDFSKGNYKGKDFTQVLARNTNFAGSNLAGCRFPKAYLIDANYENADIRGVSFEGTNMEGTNLKGANAAGAYFGATIVDAKSVENVDFTDAQFPPKTLALMCDRPDMKGTNPSTGVDTRESAMCP